MLSIKLAQWSVTLLVRVCFSKKQLLNSYYIFSYPFLLHPLYIIYHKSNHFVNETYEME